MKRTEVENALKDMNTMILQGDVMNAFEKYYHEDVKMQENEMQPTVSKEANRRRELDFFSKVTEVKSPEVLSYAIGDDISFVELRLNYHHKEWGPRNYTQVAFQHWKDGLIINEKFIYPN